MPAIGFREQIISASVTVAGNPRKGETESIQLPNLEWRRAEDTPLGLPGTVLRFLGLEAIEVELVFDSVQKDILTQWGSFNIRKHQFRVNYVTQSSDGTFKNGVVEFSGRAHTVNRGVIDGGEDAPTTTLMITCVQYKETYDGADVYDIDIEAEQVKIDGEDVWADVKSGT